MAAITGAAITVDLPAERPLVDAQVYRARDWIGVDGTAGAVVEHGADLIEPEVDEHFQRALQWADEIAPSACARAPHMFMAADRQPKMRAMILAADEEGRRRALGDLRPLAQRDFEQLFEAMKGPPVTIRSLDPPLHEFLPTCPSCAPRSSAPGSRDRTCSASSSRCSRASSNPGAESPVWLPCKRRSGTALTVSSGTRNESPTSGATLRRSRVFSLYAAAQ